MIDAGISARQIAQRLEHIAVDLKEIDAILVTHEHIDHIKGLAVLALKMKIPLFVNNETAKAIHSFLGSSARFKIFSTGESFVFGDLEIHPFSIQHDAVDPVAFRIKVDSLKIGICADLGFVSSLVVRELQDCHYLYVEANHQPSMVYASSRPKRYKERVLGRLGHLSNEECAHLLLQVWHSGLRHVYLAHLSSECNSFELACKIVADSLRQKHLSVPTSIAYQEKISEAVFF